MKTKDEFPFALDQPAEDFFTEIARLLVDYGMARPEAIQLLHRRFGGARVTGGDIMFHETPKYWAVGLWESLHG